MQEVESSLLLVVADSVDPLPINGSIDELLYFPWIGICYQPVLQSESTQKGIKTGSAPALITQADKGFVEDDGEDATME